MPVYNPRSRFFVASDVGAIPGDRIWPTAAAQERLTSWSSFDAAVRAPGVYVTTSSDTATAIAAMAPGRAVYEVSVTGNLMSDVAEMAAGTAYYVDGVATVVRVIPLTAAKRHAVLAKRGLQR